MNGNEIRDVRADIKELVKNQAETNVLVRTLADAFRQEREGSYAHRQEIREALGEIEGRLSVQENLSRVIEDKLSSIAPHVEDYRQTRAEAQGAAKLAKSAANIAKVLWAIIATIVSALITTIWWWLSSAPSPPPSPPFPWGTL